MGKITDTETAPLTEAVRVVRRRWRIIAICLIVVTASAVGFSLLQEKQYTASSELLFQQTNFDQQLFGTAFFLPTQDPQQEAATNQQLVSLPIVSQRTAQVIGGITAGHVASDVSISPVGQANVVQISATDASPQMAARIANTYAQQYVIFRQQADRRKISGALQLVQAEIGRLTAKQRNSPQGLSLSSRGQQLQVLASLQTGNAEVVQPANVPGGPSLPQTKRNGELGLVIGLLLGLGLAFLADRLDQKIRGADDLEHTFGVPVLGVVPENSALEQKPTEEALPHGVAEAFALLRARLRYFNVDRELRSLLISSAAPQDGKSTVALRLAVAEAQVSGNRVLLLEADLRRPTLARRLGVPPRPGLAELLTGGVTLDEVLQKVEVRAPSTRSTGQTHVSLIPAGDVPPNPAELVESRAMLELLGELQARFDFIIIDSPPAGAVSDALHLMRLADGIIIVSRIGKNTRGAARYLREQLKKMGVPVLGVVANGMPAGDPGYYGYGYYGGYDYSPGDVDGSAADGELVAKRSE